ncbi:MAG: DUF3990 domain-containing protein [Treponema sp.]|jgi:hypothetical protein|nr:DUF3990 domain-containing protein [Treponema sp.]
MELYHGGMEAVERPRIINPANYRTTDFGAGFYTTTDYEQARKWVLIRRSRFQTAGGFVSVFEAPDDLLQDERLSRLVFQSADKRWLEFVMNNRNHADFSHDYDLVAGPVANDRVYAALTLFEEGLLDFDETIRRLKTYELINQILFHTEKSLRELTFLRSGRI